MALSGLDQIGSLWLEWAFGFDGLLICVSSVAAFCAFARHRFY